MAAMLADESDKKIHDVIVVGAGISGLSAGRLLHSEGVDVLVLEARDRVGGRTHTLREASFGYTDVGGAYVGPTQRRVARLARELGLEFYKVNEEEKTVFNMEGVFRKYRGEIPPIYNPLAILDLNYFQQRVNAMAKQVPVDKPWAAKKAKEWDSVTYQQFIDSICWTSVSKKLAELVCRSLLCCEPYEISLLHMLWYVNSGQCIQRLVTITNGAQERKFVGGASRLSEEMARELGAGRVQLSQPVIHIEQSPHHVTVTTATAHVYKAKHVISAMPQTLLNRVTFVPPLPAQKLQLIQRMPMGSIIKTIMFYDSAFWREEGLCGQLICDESPVQYCMDDTKPDGSHPAIMGFILSAHARHLMSMDVEHRKKAVADHYAKMFRNEKFKHPVHYVEKNWCEEEYSGGCYVANYPPGVLTSFAPSLRAAVGRVYFAGTETATEWIGYMDGAIQAGERAARQILHSVGRLVEEDIEQAEVAVDPEPAVAELLVEKYLPSVPHVLAAMLSVAAILAAAVLRVCWGA